mmetsp:Transcript_18580/g.24183  ORF Transcript_18580/g.24183 Transcript_18580/m.24183 type:complete len:173 (-) Transcript_18580:100-618(-)
MSIPEANRLELNRWLKLWRLDEYEGKLRNLGATLPVDVIDIDDSQLSTLSLKPLELKRWNDAVQELKTDKANGALLGVIQSDATRTTPAELFEEPYLFEVFDTITSFVGPQAEATVDQFEINFEATLESAFDAANGVATVISETLIIDDSSDGEEEVDASNEEPGSEPSNSP